jgi:hypothetical protein
MELHAASVLESLYSISVGASSSRQCSGILAIEGGSGVAYTTGIIVFVIYILSLVMVPSGSVSDTPIMRFQLTASFQGGLQKHEKAAKRAQRCTGFEKFSTMLSNAAVILSLLQRSDFLMLEIPCDGLVRSGAPILMLLLAPLKARLRIPVKTPMIMLISTFF